MKKQPFCVILALITILGLSGPGVAADSDAPEKEPPPKDMAEAMDAICLLYTSDAADEV